MCVCVCVHRSRLNLTSSRSFETSLSVLCVSSVSHSILISFCARSFVVVTSNHCVISFCARSFVAFAI